MNSSAQINIRERGLIDYSTAWEQMCALARNFSPNQPSEIWVLEHPPVFTLGQAGKLEHVLAPGDIPVIKTDRGGQVTYHGPGQVVIYPILRLKDFGLKVRDLVTLLETTVVDFLQQQHIKAEARCDAPGVYVNGEKIASVGLRITRGVSYHGLSFNIDMDLDPFLRINPCGYKDMTVTQLAKWDKAANPAKIGKLLAHEMKHRLLAGANAPHQEALTS